MPTEVNLCQRALSSVGGRDGGVSLRQGVCQISSLGLFCYVYKTVKVKITQSDFYYRLLFQYGRSSGVCA